MSSAAIVIGALRVKTATEYCYIVKPPGHVGQSVVRLTHKPEIPGWIPVLDTRSSHIFLFLLSLIQEGQLSVTGESMRTKYWLTP